MWKRKHTWAGAILVLLIAGAASGAVIHVPGDQPTIQAAIDAAEEGDTVLVAPGLYKEHLDFKGKEIAVKSEEGAGLTFIDGMQSGSVVVFSGGEGPGAVLQGFTVANGKAEYGGGIACSSGTNPTLLENDICWNTAIYLGGGVFCNRASPAIRGNRIHHNAAVADGFGGGGGIACTQEASPLIENDRIYENEVGCKGGGIHCEYGSAPLIRNTLVFRNKYKDPSPDGGFSGGISAGFHAAPEIVHCVIYGNEGFHGGALACYQFSTPRVVNSILWGNAAAKGKEIWVADSPHPSTLSIAYCDVEGGLDSVVVEPGCTLQWGAGMIQEDPRFVDTKADDFHLAYGSPCRNGGDSSASGDLLLDFEEDPRFALGEVDMGADEFYTHLYCTGRSMVGGAVKVTVTGVPGSTPAGFWIGSAVLENPIPTAYGEWWNLWWLDLAAPWAGPILLSPLPSSGVESVEGALPAVPPGPYTLYFQGMAGESLTNLSFLLVK